MKVRWGRDHQLPGNWTCGPPIPQWVNPARNREVAQASVRYASAAATTAGSHRVLLVFPVLFVFPPADTSDQSIDVKAAIVASTTRPKPDLPISARVESAPRHGRPRR